jgi:hypothetical protein
MQWTVRILHDQYKKYGMKYPLHNLTPGNPSSVMHLQYTDATAVTDELDNQDFPWYCSIQVCHNTSQCNTAKEYVTL